MPAPQPFTHEIETESGRKAFIDVQLSDKEDCNWKVTRGHAIYHFSTKESLRRNLKKIVG